MLSTIMLTEDEAKTVKVHMTNMDVNAFTQELWQIHTNLTAQACVHGELGGPVLLGSDQLASVADLAGLFRLALVHPDAASAKKAIVPYQGDMMNPDISLVMGSNRLQDEDATKPAYGKICCSQCGRGLLENIWHQEGEMIEDDEFADFEKHDNVAFSFVRHNRYEAIEVIQQAMKLATLNVQGLR
ncbi:hypothetical protein AK812_SmicGene36976 [Symbiodinium microadriaticum]|uniref:Uncharacterized protein n=1 Tax=Symbiodinium microadriaticum TaxID=2951 RepID=A0A1Q9CHH3_SYMMI|nr:hypothetical protein AK812_SmicGene36976 [Symbiodinium microadriaticum]